MNGNYYLGFRVSGLGYEKWTTLHLSTCGNYHVDRTLVPEKPAKFKVSK